MNIRITLALLFAALFLSPNFTRAADFIGGDQYYECLGNNSYGFTLRVFKDCDSTGPTTNYTITIESPSGCGTTAQVLLTKTSTKEVTPLCFSQIIVSKCTNTNGSYDGVREYKYYGTHTFTETCSDWEVTIDTCCRTANIGTFPNPNTQSYFSRMTLYNVGGLCNSSPVFTGSGVRYICTAQNTCYNPGAYDPDGDSLVFALVPVLGANGSPITYNSPYNAAYPLPTIGNVVSFDSKTGSICFSPSSSIPGQFRVRAFEFRCGLLIGSSDHEVNMIPGNCQTAAPQIPGGGYHSISSGTALDTNSFFVNQGSTLTFTIRGTDVNSGDFMALTSNILDAIPGASWSTNGFNPVTATISWTPTTGDIGHHAFMVRVDDGTCNYWAEQSYPFEIWVGTTTHFVPPTLSAAITAPSGYSFNSGQIDLSVANGSSPFSYQWSNGLTVQDPVGVFGGTYDVIVIDNNGCIVMDTFEVPACYANANLGSDQAICVGDTLVINAAAGMTNYSWCNGDTSNSITVTGAETVCLTVTDSIGCMATDTMEVTVAMPVLDLGPDQHVCTGDTLSIQPGTFAAYNWCSGNSGAIEFVTDSGWICLTVTDINGCDASDSMYVTRSDPPTVIWGLTSNGLTANFKDSTVNAKSWSWAFGNGKGNILQDPTHTYDNAGTYNVCLTVTDSMDCSSTTCQDVTIGGIGFDEKLGGIIEVYPNPTSDRVTLNSTDQNVLIEAVQVFDLQGKEVATKELPGISKAEFGLGKLPSSSYLIRIVTNRGQLNRVILKR